MWIWKQQRNLVFLRNTWVKSFKEDGTQTGSKLSPDLTNYWLHPIAWTSLQFICLTPGYSNLPSKLNTPNPGVCELILFLRITPRETYQGIKAHSRQNEHITLYLKKTVNVTFLLIYLLHGLYSCSKLDEREIELKTKKNQLKTLKRLDKYRNW